MAQKKCPIQIRPLLNKFGWQYVDRYVPDCGIPIEAQIAGNSEAEVLLYEEPMMCKGFIAEYNGVEYYSEESAEAALELAERQVKKDVRQRTQDLRDMVAAVG